MKLRKTKIVLDADVIIHFMEADCFSLLPAIFPEYEYLILDVVYDEISKNSKTKDFIDKYLHFFSRLKKELFVPKGESIKECYNELWERAKVLVWFIVGIIEMCWEVVI